MNALPRAANDPVAYLLPDLTERVESLFTPERRKRALEWAQTPEGRESLRTQRDELAKLRPKTPEPK